MEQHDWVNIKSMFYKAGYFQEIDVEGGEKKTKQNIAHIFQLTNKITCKHKSDFETFYVINFE